MNMEETLEWISKHQYIPPTYDEWLEDGRRQHIAAFWIFAVILPFVGVPIGIFIGYILAS